MDEKDLIISNSNLMITLTRLTLSRDEIKIKHPTRIDLLTSMELGISHLTESIVITRALEKEYRMLRSRCLDLEIINSRNEAIILQLKSTTDNILDTGL